MLPPALLTFLIIVTKYLVSSKIVRCLGLFASASRKRWAFRKYCQSIEPQGLCLLTHFLQRGSISTTFQNGATCWGPSLCTLDHMGDAVYSRHSTSYKIPGCRGFPCTRFCWEGARARALMWQLLSFPEAGIPQVHPTPGFLLRESVCFHLLEPCH